MKTRKKKNKNKHKFKTQPDNAVTYYAINGENDGIEKSSNVNSRRDFVTIEAKPILKNIDHDLLETCRKQWQVGDWESLSKYSTQQIKSHPDRGKLALLAAAGCFHINKMSEAKNYLQLARKWSCSKKLINRVLIAGVYNTIGRANLISSNAEKSKRFFERSVQLGTPGSQVEKLVDSRVKEQVGQLHQSSGTSMPDSLSLLDELGLPFNTPQLSISHEDELTKKNAGLADYLNKNGEELYESGKFKMAAEFFYRAFQIEPKNAWYCQNLAEAVSRMEFKKGEFWECAGLRDLLLKLGKWDVAVRYYRKALKLDLKVVKEHKDSQVFRIDAESRTQIDSPVFIVGCGHSGTSLLLALLGNHPRLYPIPEESALFLRTDIEIQKTFQGWDDDCKQVGKSRWIEKTPPHVFQMQRFQAFRANSKFIIMLRDGRDVVASLKHRVGYSGIKDRLDRWVYDNMAGMPYWSDPHVHAVKYEDLVESPERILNNICDFLGETYRPEMLDYYKTEHYWYSDKVEKPKEIRDHEDHINLRNWQINQPIFDGRNRWVAEMGGDEITEFKTSEAQGMLEQLGYVSDANW